MNEEEAKKWLAGAIQTDNCLYNLGHYICWDGGEEITLDDAFTVGELEAIVWWMRNKEITK